MRSCKNCGCVNDNINRYCRNCGSFLEENKGERAPAAPISETMPHDEAEYLPAPKELLPEVEEYVPEPPEEAEYIPTPEQFVPEVVELAPSGSTEVPEKDFFDLDPIPPALFDSDAEGMVLFDGPAPEVPPEPDYIEFDLGEDEEEDEDEETEPAPTEKARAVLRSPLYRFFAVFASAGLLLTLLKTVLTLVGSGSLLGIGTPYADLVDMLFIAGFDRISVYTAALMGAPAYYILQTVAVLPAVLYCVGIWLLFAAGCRKEGELGSLGVLNAANIISLTGYGICFAMSCTFGISVIAAIGYGGEQAVHFAGLLLLCAFLALISIVGALYSGFAILTVNRMKKAIKEDAPEHRVSIFVIVMNLLIALSVSSISGFYLAGGDMVSFLLSIINMITYVLLTMVMVRYRIELK